MFGCLGSFANVILSFLHPMALFDIAWSILPGIVIGILPGLTATMGVATSGSAIGTLIGMLFLATLAPMLGNYGLKFSPMNSLGWPFSASLSPAS